MPRLNLGDTSDASDDDSFFESKVPLTGKSTGEHDMCHVRTKGTSCQTCQMIPNFHKWIHYFLKI